MRSRLPALLLVLLICGYHWRLLFSSEFTWLETPGVYEHTLPLMQYQASEIHEGRLPLWDPYTNSGRPLIGFGKPSPLYPPHLVMLALPLKSGWLSQNVLHWYFVLIQCAMALSMYALARTLGQSSPASFLAACIYALSGEVAASHQPHLMHASVFVPLVFRFLARKEAVWTGLCLGLCWWPGSLEIPLLTTLGAFVFAGIRTIGWKPMAAFFTISIVIGAVGILPGWQFFDTSLFTTKAPDLSSTSWIAMILALLGFSSVNGRSMAMVAAIGLALSTFGGTILFHLGVAAGAGWGSELANDFWRRWIARLLIAAAILLIYFDAVAWTLRWKIVEQNGALVLSGFLALALALLFLKGQPRNTPITALVLFVIGLSQATSPLWQSRFEKERPRKLVSLTQHADLAGYLRKKKPRAVIDPKAIAYDFGLWWNIETHSTLDPRWNALLWVSDTPHSDFPEMLFRGTHGVHVFGSGKALAQSRPRLSCAGQTRQIEFTAQQFAIESESECDGGWIHSGIRYSPGWAATVDGNRSQLLRLEGDEQGIPVAKGHHRIKVTFLPITVLAGGAISSLGLLLTFILARKRRINYS